MTERIGFIGLGRMGQPMASRLLEAGFPLIVWNRTKEKTDDLAKKGAEVAGSPKEVASESDVTITMISDGPVLKAVALGENGVLKKLQCVEVEWKPKEKDGPPVPMEKPGTDFEVEADLVLLAMGFLGPEKNKIVEDQGIALDSRGNVKADEKNMTSVPGVFVAGDMTLGQSLVVRAIADGRRAAHGIMTYLGKP